MSDFSLKTITTPCISVANQAFEMASDYLMRKNPSLDRSKINHDVKAVAFNIATIFLGFIGTLCLLSKLGPIKSVVSGGALYIARTVIDETMSFRGNMQAAVHEGNNDPDAAFESAKNALRAAKNKVKSVVDDKQAVKLAGVKVFEYTNYSFSELISLFSSKESNRSESN